MTIREAVKLYDEATRTSDRLDKLYGHITSARAGQINANLQKRPDTFEFKLSKEDTDLLLKAIGHYSEYLYSLLENEFMAEAEPMCITKCGYVKKEADNE